MPYLDRDDFIRTIDRLGDPDDAVALAAARDVGRRLADTGMTWDGLLVPPPGAAREIGEPPEPGEHPIETLPASKPIAPGTAESESQLIDRLLAGYELSTETREMLLEFKDDIGRGEFTEADHAYVKGLAARLATRSRA